LETAKHLIILRLPLDMQQHNAMSRRSAKMPKRTPSDHQKRIRFLTGLIIVIVMVATVLIFWIANQGLSLH